LFIYGQHYIIDRKRDWSRWKNIKYIYQITTTTGTTTNWRKSFAILGKVWDSFFTSSIYHTILFTGALFSSVNRFENFLAYQVVS